MTAHKRISRSDAHTFTAGEKKKRSDDAAAYAEKLRQREQEREDNVHNRTRRGFN